MLLIVAISLYTGCIGFESTTRIRILTVKQSPKIHFLQTYILAYQYDIILRIVFLPGLHSGSLQANQALLRITCCIHVQSFYFYIPHKRLKPGGHLQHPLLIPHPWHPFNGVVRESNGKDSKSTVVTVRRRQLNLLLGSQTQIFFIPSYTLWRRGTLDYSLLIHHNRVGQTIMLRLL